MEKTIPLRDSFSRQQLLRVLFRRRSLPGWLSVLFICLVPIGMVLRDTDNPGLFSSGISFLNNLGIIIGVIGFTLYALALVLSTRWRFIEKAFGGLSVVYVAHHILGGLSLAFLLLHPLLLAGAYALNSVYYGALLLMPHGLTPLSGLFNQADPFHTLIVRQWAILCGEIALLSMLGLLMLTFYVKLSYHLWYITHRLLGPVFFIAGLHTILINFDFGGMPLRVYMVGIFCLGCIGYAYRGIFGAMLVRRYRYIIEYISLPSSDVMEIVLRPMGNEIDFRPGQFVYIRFPDAHIPGLHPNEWHPFSISSAPFDKKIRLTVKQLGDFTKHMAGLMPGMVAEIEGAYGGFSYTNFANKNQIWIAGGIGISPFIGMDRSLYGSAWKVDLYYSVRTESEMVDVMELRRLIALEPQNLRVFPFVSTKAGSHLTADFVEKASGELKNKEIFICGPPAMMQSLRRQFKKKGVSGTNIHTEEFSLM